jgi:polysaccharide export outer membrane protein
VRPSRHFSACLAALVLLLAGCEPGADLPVLPAADIGQIYKLGSGDEVRITTFGEKDLSGDFGVDDSGFVSLPLAGPVHAEGLTTRGLADEIGHTLRAKNLLADPNVVVEVVRYRPIFVLGEVQRPGPYPYQVRMSFLNAVAMAGGFTPRAVKSHATVVRGTEKGRIDQVGQIEPGDIITVEERNF